MDMQSITDVGFEKPYSLKSTKILLNVFGALKEIYGVVKCKQPFSNSE